LMWQEIVDFEIGRIFSSVVQATSSCRANCLTISQCSVAQSGLPAVACQQQHGTGECREEATTSGRE
jgi:hypothetical protein